MTKFARIDGGVVAETIETDQPLADIYHPDLAALFEVVPPDVVAGMERQGDGTFAAPVAATADIEAIKSALAVRVDADAETERGRHITPGAGQAMSYMAKAQQAADYLSAVAPDEGDYPLLAAEIGITGETVADVAGIVNAAYQSWIVIGAQIEAARLAAKRDIAAAETVEAAQAVYDALAWPEVPE